MQRNRAPLLIQCETNTPTERVLVLLFVKCPYSISNQVFELSLINAPVRCYWRSILSLTFYVIPFKLHSFLLAMDNGVSCTRNTLQKNSVHVFVFSCNTLNIHYGFESFVFQCNTCAPKAKCGRRMLNVSAKWMAVISEAGGIGLNMHTMWRIKMSLIQQFVLCGSQTGPSSLKFRLLIVRARKRESVCVCIFASCRSIAVLSAYNKSFECENEIQWSARMNVKSVK